LFSTTRKGKELSKESYIKMDDVPSATYPSAVYTDGIGIITPEYAKELSEQMNLSTVPSAFQIRCGGYKGICIVSKTKILLDGGFIYF
jgi:RNA-dependent RNA polymerase